MEGPQIKIPLARFMEALQKGDKELVILIKDGLKELAERYQMEQKFLLHLVDDILEKVKEETLRFNPKLPYPPAHANNLSVQVDLPTKGKVGVCEFNSQIKV